MIVGGAGPFSSGTAGVHGDACEGAVKVGAVAIEMTGVNKWYGTFHALKDIDLSIREASGW